MNMYINFAICVTVYKQENFVRSVWDGPRYHLVGENNGVTLNAGARKKTTKKHTIFKSYKHKIL
jgi:hypothetical protein